MASKIAKRDVSPALQLLREFFLGRKLKTALRYQDMMSPRPGPQPNLPDGPAALISANRYFDRDGRRETLPPQQIAILQKQITSGTESEEVKIHTNSGLPLPGKPYVGIEVKN